MRELDDPSSGGVCIVMQVMVMPASMAMTADEVCAPRTSPAAPTAAEIDWSELSVSLARFGLALTGDRHEADDLMQQALTRVMTRAPSRAAHAGYLRRTMVRLWLDRRRTLRREMLRLTRVAAERVGDMLRGGGASDERDPTAADGVARVRAAMDLLPPKQHAALALRLIEGLEYPAIAEALDIDVAAARANVHLAKARIRRALEVHS